MPKKDTPEVLIGAAWDAARAVEAAAEESGMPFFACQSRYGVVVEVLAGGTWHPPGDIVDGFAVAAVRFADCDGNRGQVCRTVRQVTKDRDRWVRIARSYSPTQTEEVENV